MTTPTARSAFALALTLVVAGLAIPAVSAQTIHRTPAWMEAEEEGRANRDLEGQSNCVPEARNGAESLACPERGTGKPYPAKGIRMLDGYVAATTWFRDPRQDPDDPTSLRIPIATASPRREMGPSMPDVIPPGFTDLHAWWGIWNDLDGDGVVTYSYHDPSTPTASNEWVREPLRSNTLSSFDIASYLEPGSHPGYGSWERPDRHRPDAYYYADDAYYAQETSGPILFIDGSLLQTLTVTTVTDALLAPSSDTKAYTPTVDSLVDIDVYVAVAPSPVAELWAENVAPATNEVGSPSFGLAPGKGALAPPELVSETPAAEGYGDAVGIAYAPYPREWAHDSASTGAGRRAQYESEYAGWVDLTIEYGPLGHPHGFDQLLVPRPGPMPGRGDSGGMAVAPGWATFSLWTGVWHDRNKDGHVGDAGDDPYLSGARPNPDDYDNNGGEFFAAPPLDDRGQPEYQVSLTLVPDGEWGSPGVVVYDTSGTLPVTSTTTGAACVPHPTLNRNICVADPKAYVANDGRTITLPLVPHPSTHGPGHFRSAFLLFPAGSQVAFTACTEPLPIAYAKAGVKVDETLQDCDTFEAFDPSNSLGAMFKVPPV